MIGLSAVTPGSSRVGTPLTITGWGLADPVSVTVGGVDASPFQLPGSDDTTLRIAVPNAGSSGAHQVVVRTHDGVSNALTWTQEGDVDGAEPNDAPAEATAVPVPVALVQSFNQSDRQDFYRFTLTSTVTVRALLFWNTGSDLDVLVQPAGTAVAFEGDGSQAFENDLCGSTGATANPKIVANLFSVKIRPMTANPNTYHHGDLRTALIESALRILEAEPVEAVTLRRLARETGVTHTAPYHHFPDRRTLLGAVAARGFRDLQDAMTVETGGSHFTRLRAAGTAYVTFAVEHPELFRLMFSGRWKDSTDHPELREAATRVFDALQGMLAVALPDGYERSDLAVPARAAWALVHGTAILLIDGGIDTPPGLSPREAAAKLTEQLTGVLGRGLRSL